MVGGSVSYYRARYYDSQAGRFLSEDPIGYAGGDNFYIYAENAPASLVDPFGLCPRKSKDMAGQNQYADDESGPLRSVGSPGGPEITNDTLDLEALLMAQTMQNVGHIGNAATYTGLPLGKIRTDLAKKSAEGSSLCIMLKRAISAVNNATSSPGNPAIRGWRSVVQGRPGHHFVRDLGNGIRVAGTDFQF